jgi:hypothetical protein
MAPSPRQMTLRFSVRRRLEFLVKLIISRFARWQTSLAVAPAADAPTGFKTVKGSPGDSPCVATGATRTDPATSTREPRDFELSRWGSEMSATPSQAWRRVFSAGILVSIPSLAAFGVRNTIVFANSCDWKELGDWRAHRVTPLWRIIMCLWVKPEILNQKRCKEISRGGAEAEEEMTNTIQTKTEQNRTAVSVSG